MNRKTEFRPTGLLGEELTVLTYTAVIFSDELNLDIIDIMYLLHI